MRLLLVEDSRAVVAFIQTILRPERDIELLPPVSDGVSGVAAAQRLRPQLILMDLGLPGLDGIRAIEEIMATAPCSIVVLSGQLDAPGQDRTFESFRAGAVEVLAKPVGLGPGQVRLFRERLLRTLRVMAEARVVGRRSRARRVLEPAPVPPSVPTGRRKLIAMGGSTGAPSFIHEILQALPAPAPVPIVVAQHMVPGFEQGFATWLCTTRHTAVVARDGEWMEPGKVYVAPADRNLLVRGMQLEVRPSRHIHTPSVDELFLSVAESHGVAAVALLLTGMGEDGARGMLALRRAGGLTVTQSRESCVVDSMPSAARALGGSCHTLSPAEMAGLLRELTAPEAAPRARASSR